MTIKIGDRVRFLNDVGGGIVTAFIDEKTVEVQTDDGFEIPVMANELLIEASNAYGMGDESKEDSESKVERQEEVYSPILKPEDFKYKEFSGEILLAIVPENDTLLHVSDFSLYLVNDSNYCFSFVISQIEKNVNELIRVGTIEADTKIEIKKYNQSTLSKINKFHMQGFFYKEGLFDAGKALDTVSKLDGVSFYKSNQFSENEYFQSKAYLLNKARVDFKAAIKNLSDTDIEKAALEKESVKKPEKKAGEKKDLEEIDLHIEEIVENHSGLSNGEILEIQMGRFETALETAINSNIPKIVFIHGIGNGRLKHELIKKLERKYPSYKYQDASFKEYGYGATLVYLR